MKRVRRELERYGGAGNENARKNSQKRNKFGIWTPPPFYKSLFRDNISIADASILHRLKVIELQS